MAQKGYTLKEKKDVLYYIITKNAFSEVKGRKFWMEFANSASTDRSWQSLKEVFIKRILPDIQNPFYRLSQDDIKAFRNGARSGNCINWVSKKKHITSTSDSNTTDGIHSPTTSNKLRNKNNEDVSDSNSLHEAKEERDLNSQHIDNTSPNLSSIKDTSSYKQQRSSKANVLSSSKNDVDNSFNKYNKAKNTDKFYSRDKKETDIAIPSISLQRKKYKALSPNKELAFNSQYMKSSSDLSSVKDVNFYKQQKSSKYVYVISSGSDMDNTFHKREKRLKTQPRRKCSIFNSSPSKIFTKADLSIQNQTRKRKSSKHYKHHTSTESICSPSTTTESSEETSDSCTSFKKNKKYRPKFAMYKGKMHQIYCGNSNYSSSLKRCYIDTNNIKQKRILTYKSEDNMLDDRVLKKFCCVKVEQLFCKHYLRYLNEGKIGHKPSIKDYMDSESVFKLEHEENCMYYKIQRGRKIHKNVERKSAIHDVLSSPDSSDDEIERYSRINRLCNNNNKLVKVREVVQELRDSPLIKNEEQKKYSDHDNGSNDKWKQKYVKEKERNYILTKKLLYHNADESRGSSNAESKYSVPVTRPNYDRPESSLSKKDSGCRISIFKEGEEVVDNVYPLDTQKVEKFIDFFKKIVSDDSTKIGNNNIDIPIIFSKDETHIIDKEKEIFDTILATDDISENIDTERKIFSSYEIGLMLNDKLGDNDKNSRNESEENRTFVSGLVNQSTPLKKDTNLKKKTNDVEYLDTKINMETEENKEPNVNDARTTKLNKASSKGQRRPRKLTILDLDIVGKDEYFKLEKRKLKRSIHENILKDNFEEQVKEIIADTQSTPKKIKESVLEVDVISSDSSTKYAFPSVKKNKRRMKKTYKKQIINSAFDITKLIKSEDIHITNNKQEHLLKLKENSVLKESKLNLSNKNIKYGYNIYNSLSLYSSVTCSKNNEESKIRKTNSLKSITNNSSDVDKPLKMSYSCEDLSKYKLSSPVLQSERFELRPAMNRHINHEYNNMDCCSYLNNTVLIDTKTIQKLTKEIIESEFTNYKNLEDTFIYQVNHTEKIRNTRTDNGDISEENKNPNEIEDQSITEDTKDNIISQGNEETLYSLNEVFPHTLMDIMSEEEVVNSISDIFSDSSCSQ